MTEGANYLQRYLAGERLTVWQELTARAEQLLTDPVVMAQAEQVADATFTRVRGNLERLITHLEAIGYEFEDPPIGSRRIHGDKQYLYTHFIPADDEMQTDIDQIRRRVRHLPLSLEYFWTHVGAVALTGAFPTAGGSDRFADALFVYPPEVTLADWRDYELSEDDELRATIAPDFLHKDDVSGGAPYTIALGAPCADAALLDTPYVSDDSGVLRWSNPREDLDWGHSLYAESAGIRPAPPFVSYLRFALLTWGGFPGFAASAHRESQPFIDDIVSALEPF